MDFGILAGILKVAGYFIDKWNITKEAIYKFLANVDEQTGWDFETRAGNVRQAREELRRRREQAEVDASPEFSLLYEYALSMLGTPYRWGGDDPMAGFDCSGLIVELFQSVGIIEHGTDYTAQQLHDLVSIMGAEKEVYGFGSLVFYGTSPEKITHIGLMMDESRIIEAGGGGRKIKTVEDAIRYNAHVRIRPYDYRPDVVAVLRPNY